MKEDYWPTQARIDWADERLKAYLEKTAMRFDHTIYFDSVRDSLFSGSMEQDQVDGQEAILGVWEKYRQSGDLRFLAYMLATTYHETASEMMPIEEYGKGSGHDYGKIDPETGQAYYGRGFVQLTWRDNYARGDREIMEKFNIATGMEAKASNALIPVNAAAVMFLGMEEGWFRSDKNGPQTLGRWFSNTHDDAFMAREIINGDKTTVPSWSNGVSIGTLVAGYHQKFLTALYDARIEAEPSQDTPAVAQDEGSDDQKNDPQGIVNVATDTAAGVQIEPASDPVEKEPPDGGLKQ